MSAFIVSNAHINAIVSWANLNSYGLRQTSQELAQTGRMLLAENCKSVAARYSNMKDAAETELAAYRFAYDPKPRSAVQIIKACDCLAYQSSEHDGWKDSAAKRFLDEVRERAISKLPGYDGAEWEIAA